MAAMDIAATVHAQGAGENEFRKMATVLMHPRCLNCHTSVDFPKQGDDRHAHRLGIIRGTNGNGAIGMQCATCHQSTNNSASKVPGAPNWHLAPSSMAWEKLSVSDLCHTLKDRSKNGGRDVNAIVEHMTQDKLVQWAWSPGEQRTTPPLMQSEFHDLVRSWAALGAACPQQAGAAKDGTAKK
ncbi:MAG: hypothetical protein V4488_12435 [Pseudomonadota bacterium]